MQLNGMLMVGNNCFARVNAWALSEVGTLRSRRASESNNKV